MADDRTVLEQTYAAFNARNIDGVLAMMTEDVHWPRASESGTVIGKEEIRAYWTRQWSEFDPNVEPLALCEESNGTLCVRVHQLVRSLEGVVLSDSELVHIFTMRDGGIAAMTLGDEANAFAAFTHRD